MKKISLKAQHDSFMKRHHPWIFSGAIEKADNDIENGETVEISSSTGEFLAYGAFSEKSQIRIRVWTFNSDETIDADFINRRLQKSIQARENLLVSGRTNACRLVNSESDGLPGLIVDKYNDFLVCQFLAAGSEFWKKEIVEILHTLVPCKGVFERSDSEARLKEGLNEETNVLWGEIPPQFVEIFEDGCRYYVDMITGHKTGFYLDQRENRKLVKDFVKDKTVLNCFSYSGGFGLQASAGGAKFVSHVDSSANSLEIAKNNYVLNNMNTDNVEFLEADVFHLLRGYRDSRKEFDVIILDPPKFAQSADQIMKASRGYKDINLLAIKLLKPGGILFTFSCSGHITRDLFQKIIAGAALDSNRDVRLIGQLSQAEDHSIAFNFPESEYLKGFICQVY